LVQKRQAQKNLAAAVAILHGAVRVRSSQLPTLLASLGEAEIVWRIDAKPLAEFRRSRRRNIMSEI
jgi:hypothetical protein